MNNPIQILIIWWLLKEVRETFIHSRDDCVIVVWKIRKKEPKNDRAAGERGGPTLRIPYKI